MEKENKLSRGKGQFINCTDYDDALEFAKQNSIDFANWIDGCMYSRVTDGEKYLGWTDGTDMIAKSTEELYELFLNRPTAAGCSAKNNGA